MLLPQRDGGGCHRNRCFPLPYLSTIDIGISPEIRMPVRFWTDLVQSSLHDMELMCLPSNCFVQWQFKVLEEQMNPACSHWIKFKANQHWGKGTVGQISANSIHWVMCMDWPAFLNRNVTGKYCAGSSGIWILGIKLHLLVWLSSHY